MKNLFLTAACLTLFALPGKAQQAAPPAQTFSFSLADCIKYAYEHQDSVKNAELDVKSAEYKIKETIGTGLPQINGSVSFQDYLKVPTQVGPENFANPDKKARLVPFPVGPTKYNNTLSLQASQILFSGTYIVGLQTVKTFKELSQRSLTRTKIQTNVNVTKAYYQVLVSDEQIKLLDANIVQLKQQLDQTVQQNKQGFVEKIDVDRITVQYNNLITNRDNVSRLLVLNVDMLKFQMGMNIENELKLTDKLTDVKLDNIAVNVSDTNFYHNRIEYNLLETAKKLNELEVKNRKAAFFPSLVATGGLSTVYQENQTGFLYDANYPYSFIGLSLTIPIFNGGQRTNQLRQAQIDVQKSQNQLDNVKNGFSLQAKAARISYYNGIQSLNTQKRSRELATEVLRVSKIKYEQGVGSSIEVTQAQTALETADNQYIQALYDALVNKVNLDQAYGRIN